jgi:5-methylcytosine-specific restriction enzyme B
MTKRLQDLNKLIMMGRDRVLSYENIDLKIPIEFWNEFKNKYEGSSTDTVVHFNEYSFSIKNNISETADVSARWLLYAYSFASFFNALDDYRAISEKMFNDVGITSLSPELKKEILKLLPGENWVTEVDTKRPGTSSAISNQINSIYAMDPISKARLNKFLSNQSWWNYGKPGKPFDRTASDWMGSAVKAAAGVIQANADRLPAIVRVIAKNKALHFWLTRIIKNQSKLKLHFDPAADRKKGGRNVIYYGAPGTGKSFKIIQHSTTHAENQVTTTVFHSDTQNCDFVGSLKPSMVEGKINYAFQPGPFITAYIKAINTPGVMNFLIIEELNRAPAAAVFGELFQLLDRNADGESVYSITPADPSLHAYLEQHLNYYDQRIKIPSNLSIFASMNSSDQAVMPLDTAFKRRWEFVYTPVSFETCSNGTLPIPDTAGNIHHLPWKDLGIAINNRLAQLGVSEDRFLGPYFLTDKEIEITAQGTHENASSALCGKIFMYLWDDVLRHGSRDHIFLSEIKTFGELVKRYQSNNPIFNVDLIQELIPTTDTSIEAKFIQNAVE